MVPNIAVVGCGYWGKNIVRNFYELGALRSICDLRESVLNELGTTYQVRTSPRVEEILSDPQVEGVAIAAPAAQHYDLVMRSLLAGKHVLVEKPLALHLEDGQKLVMTARECQRLLMIGHILQYHPAILKLKELISSGELGQIKYIYSSRLNLGKLRTEENILWSFAPHDISAILFLLEEMPLRITSQGGTYLDSQIVDTTMTICDFKSGVKAHIFVSWLHPFKEQKLTIVGGKKMAVFDDMESRDKLVLYSHRIDWIDRVPVAHKDGGQVIALPNEEPLRSECQHFLDCIRSGQTPRTNGENGLQVLQVLEACGRSLRNKGQPVEVEVPAPVYFAHPTAVIDPGCEIGAGTKIWHFTHIMSSAKLGARCNLGQNVVVSPDCKIGDNVKIQNNVSVYTGVELEDDVFCGPSMVFTNVVNPRSHVIRRHEYQKTLVKKGASIGANATIVCGTTLGRYSFIGAGAVVTRDVPDYALMVGVPARQTGWMCSCGIRLPNGTASPICPECHRHYRIEELQLKELEPATTTATPTIDVSGVAA
ncbi:MAG: Gfo/Idh/MocA family oxidoreductase [Acidobacteriia bacterium]|nr:Gfo/Idh/MocA family oxidoreductase [Terriglobia bacterium]